MSSIRNAIIKTDNVSLIAGLGLKNTVISSFITE